MTGNGLWRVKGTRGEQGEREERRARQRPMVFTSIPWATQNAGTATRHPRAGAVGNNLVQGGYFGEPDAELISSDSGEEGRERTCDSREGFESILAFWEGRPRV